MGGSKDGLKVIIDGLIDGIIYMFVVEEGGLVIEKVFKFFKGEKIEFVI